jgi:DNA-binding Lrp family transcriptional regulator
MKRMEEDGVVRGYTIREAGIGLTALVRIKVGPGTEIGTLAGEFAGWEGVECVYEISGDADLIGIVHIDDTVALRDLLDRMWLTAPGDITSTQTELVLEHY